MANESVFKLVFFLNFNIKFSSSDKKIYGNSVIKQKTSRAGLIKIIIKKTVKENQLKITG